MREPKPCEVWVDPDDGMPMLIDKRRSFIDLNTGEPYGSYDGAKYAAPSARTYYMQEVWEKWDYLRRLDGFNVGEWSKWLKEQCELEGE